MKVLNGGCCGSVFLKAAENLGHWRGWGLATEGTSHCQGREAQALLLCYTIHVYSYKLSGQNMVTNKVLHRIYTGGSEKRHPSD